MNSVHAVHHADRVSRRRRVCSTLPWRTHAVHVDVVRTAAAGNTQKLAECTGWWRHFRIYIASWFDLSKHITGVYQKRHPS